MTRFRGPRLWVALAAALTAAPVPVAALTETGGAGAAHAAEPGVPRSSGVAAHRFYLRGGLALEASTPKSFKDKNCSSTSPAALYGCGYGVDGAPLSSLGDFGTAAGVDLGVGYAVAPSLRLEAVVHYRPSFSFKGRANFLQVTARQDVTAKLSSLSAMLAAYVDLPALGFPRLGPLSPFIGGGAGVSRIRISDTRMEFPGTRTIVPGGRWTGFAWMAAAGVAAPVGDRMTLELAWRYIDYGTVETGHGGGRIEYRDGRPPFPLPLARTRANLLRQGLALSLRYGF